MDGIGWYGKLPCAGDFVTRRLPYALTHALDAWLRQGLSQLRGLYPDDWREGFEGAPLWNCAIPAAATSSGFTLIGMIAPSRDRVGREFPLCAGLALAPDTAPGPLLSGTHEWLTALGRAVSHALRFPTTIDAFDEQVRAIRLPPLDRVPLPSAGGDDILAILNDGPADVPTVPMPLAHALPWPELPERFDAGALTCYWWTNTAAGASLRGFTSDAGLTPSLLLTLMRPQPGAMKRRV